MWCSWDGSRSETEERDGEGRWWGKDVGELISRSVIKPEWGGESR